MGTARLTAAVQESLRRQIDTLEYERDTLEYERDTVEKACDALAEEVVVIQGRLASMTAERDALSAEVKKLKKEKK